MCSSLVCGNEFSLESTLDVCLAALESSNRSVVASGGWAINAGVGGIGDQALATICASATGLRSPRRCLRFSTVHRRDGKHHRRRQHDRAMHF